MKKNGFPNTKIRNTFHLGNDQLLELPALSFQSTEKALCFMGTLNWEPNVDGLVWFLNEVWPKIKEKETGVKMYVLGKNADQRIIEAVARQSDVELTGFVENLDEYLRKTRVYIAPLRIGSGMKVKVLEGLYRGVPSVTTSVGAEGLAVKSAEHLFIADDKKVFAKHCIDLLNEEELWTSLGRSSRELANKKYRWNDLFTAMDKDIESIL